MTQGKPLGPLHGVPISIKDLVDVKGVPTRHGSAIYADNPPAAADDILVQRLRAAGAIIFAKASTPEFGVKGLTDGPLLRRHAQSLEPRAHAGRLERRRRGRRGRRHRPRLSLRDRRRRFDARPGLVQRPSWG